MREALAPAQPHCLAPTHPFPISSPLGLADENASLRSELTELKEQMHVIATATARQLSQANLDGGSAHTTQGTSCKLGDMCTQTDFAEDAAAREEMAHWQQQLFAVSEWLKTGAALLQDAPGMG